jgi:hypothetical protein
MAEKYTKDTIESLEDYLLNFTDIAIDVYNKYHLEINKTQSIYPATVNNLDILFKRPSDFLKMRKKNKLRLDKKFFYVKSEDDIYTMDKDELLRLKQITGLASLFENQEFSEGINLSDEMNN